MFLIYNIPGLLIGLLGVFVGFLATGVTGSLSVGAIVLAAIWVGVGLWWRNNPSPSGLKRRHAALFFVPLPYLAVVPALIGLLAIPAELRAASRTPDPRRSSFTLADSNLRTANASGDPTLAVDILKAINQTAHAGMYANRPSVHATASETGVLVLVKLTNLKQFKSPARSALMQTITDAVKATPAYATKPLYIGLKGNLVYGAVQTPTTTNLVTGSEESLFAFFGDLAVPAGTP